MSRPWNERERELLHRWRKHRTMAQLASQLRRSTWAVKAEARKLGITKKEGDHRLPRGTPSAPEQKAEAIRLRQTTDLKASEIAKQVGISERTLRSIWAEAGARPPPDLQERCNREAGERLRKLDHDPKRLDRTAWANRLGTARQKQSQRMMERLATPEGKAWHRQISQKGGRAGKGHDKGMTAYHAKRMAWCPDEYKPLYRHLIYSKRYRALDAMAYVIKTMERDEARRIRSERDFVMGRRAA